MLVWLSSSNVPADIVIMITDGNPTILDSTATWGDPGDSGQTVHVADVKAASHPANSVKSSDNSLPNDGLNKQIVAVGLGGLGVGQENPVVPRNLIDRRHKSKRRLLRRRCGPP